MNNDSAHLEPARSIIGRLGGVDVVASITGKHRTNVFRWMYPPNRGGTGGMIPLREIPKLLKFAKTSGKRLRHSDFFTTARRRVPIEAETASSRRSL